MFSNVVAASSNQPGWFLEGNIGYSLTHDMAVPGATKVTQDGVGGNVAVGYIFMEYLAAEVGYTKYADARHTAAAGAALAATNQKYSIHGAGKVMWELFDKFNVHGKFGLGFFNTRIDFGGGGFFRDENAFHVYYGAGISYDITNTVQFILQRNRAQGDKKTGSADLFSFGTLVKLA